ncbi:MAG: biotin--[acetyl-CoA-carboxylase] ligase [Lachnospiraceae bacterium]|jgi:BirA family biotin operon repressor/biotin-[acetyl-CoA-carboxylase] ligase|nr:biotin--[acetyl-CoA-carboxylase] ligase [Lachnospiraceae bacterium]
MKAKILALLREREEYVSGQELCQRFGVSRTAVWKAIGQLKKEGYCIEAVKNRGYLLVPEEEVYGRHELESRMDTDWAGRPVFYYDELASTNLQAKLDAENGAGEGTLIVADMQTAGRGRKGKGWSSPAGTNVYFTLILKPDYDVEQASMVTLVMGMAVAEGIRATCGVDARIKWPNDIVAGGRKLCGMLAEMSVEREFIHYVVVGVGINVKEQVFPEEIADTATSLWQECGRKVSRGQLIVNVMKAFEARYKVFCGSRSLSGLVEEYNGMLVNKNREVRVLDPKGEFRGVSRGINEKGELLVELEDGSVTAVYAGEVSVRGVYGYV